MNVLMIIGMIIFGIILVGVYAGYKLTTQREKAQKDNLLPPDKKKHLKVARFYAFALVTVPFAIILFYFNQFDPFVSYAVGMVATISCIYAWEYLPKWLPGMIPNRNFDTEDIRYGMIGMFQGVVISIPFVIILLIIKNIIS